MSRKFYLSLTKKLVFSYRIQNSFNHYLKIRQKLLMYLDDPTKDHNLKLQVKKVKTTVLHMPRFCLCRKLGT